jgi:hypothetical protein
MHFSKVYEFEGWESLAIHFELVSKMLINKMVCIIPPIILIQKVLQMCCIY